MRLIILLLLMGGYEIAHCQNTKANDYELIVGPELNSKSNFTVSEIIGHDPSGFYVLRNKKTGLFGGLSLYKNSGHINEKARFYLEKYDYDFKLIKSYNLYDFVQKGNFDYHFIEFRNGKIYVYFSSYNADSKSRKLLVNEISKETLQPTGKLMTLYENFDIGSPSFKGEFYASRLSENEEHNLILVEKDTKNSDSRTIQLLSFNEKFDLNWEKDFTVPFAKKNVTISGISIDNYNQAHILISITNKINKSLSQFKLYSVFQYGRELKEITLNIPDKRILNIQTASLDKDHLICAGFYTREKYSSIDGTFYFKIDLLNQEIIEENYREFEIDFITQYLKENKAKKLEKKEDQGINVEMPDYKLDELIILEDGSIYLIAEQFRVDVVTTWTYNGGYYTSYYFNYNDLIVVKFDADGQVDWMTKIPKKQVSTGDEGFYSSYSMIMNNENLYFIYNDNPGNFNLDDIRKIKNYSPSSFESVTIISHIDQDGNHEKEILIGGQTIEAIIKPTISHHLSKNEIILYGHRNNYQNFIAVNLEKQ